MRLIQNIKRKQTTNIIMITFWSQFSAFAFNTILILFLTKPLLKHGLGYSQAKAYAFIGIYNATGYLMPILGGALADKVLGLRRSILLGGILLAFAYLLLTLSDYAVTTYGDLFFLAAIALIPAANSLLIGTASGMISRIYSTNPVKAKTAMTYYYMAINVGALLASFIAPYLLESHYGVLSVFALAFIGKSIAASNFAYRYRCYDNVICGPDVHPLSRTNMGRVILYLLTIYAFSLFAFFHIHFTSIVISIACISGIAWFLWQTMSLKSNARTKQSIAVLLILEAIIFFIIYNQMSTTLILFAQSHSNNHFFGVNFSPAHYQVLNPLLIIILGLQLPLFYKWFPRFSIPYQFAFGTLLAGLALLMLAFAPSLTGNGMISSGYIAGTYLLISLAELWVSAIGLSMIGLYCDHKTLGVSMGAWYLGCSLSHLCSARIAQWVALPEHISNPIQSLIIYQHYYRNIGCIACFSAVVMLCIAYLLHNTLRNKGLVLA